MNNIFSTRKLPNVQDLKYYLCSVNVAVQFIKNIAYSSESTMF